MAEEIDYNRDAHAHTVNIVSNRTNLIRTSNKHCCKYNRVVLSSFWANQIVHTYLIEYTGLFSHSKVRYPDPAFTPNKN